jgi:NAD(P)-dependent dehydrogenase (short-subunit alcohol dehydrogenase family)
MNTQEQHPQKKGQGAPEDHGVEQPKLEGSGTTDEMILAPDHGEDSYKGSGKLEGKAALITGADSGIGRAVALAFAREGADVIIAYHTSDEDARDSAQAVEAAGRRAVVVQADIREEEECKSLIERAFSEFGKLDILVNNAAYQSTHESIEEWTTEEFDRTYKTNVYAMFWLCRAAVPRMKPGSSIINTASIQAFSPSEGLLPYASTKAAIVNFTKGLAQLTADKGIRVNAVAPGPVWTPLIPATMPSDKVQSFGSDTLFKRPAQPAEQAPLYVFLASEDASYVTAETYGATGGSSPL